MGAPVRADDHDGENSSPGLCLEIPGATGNVEPLFSRDEDTDVWAPEDAGAGCEAGPEDRSA